MGLDAFAQRGVGQDQTGLGHVQRALGTDDGELAPACLGIELRDDRGGGLSTTSVIGTPLKRGGDDGSGGSDTALWLGQAGDVGHLLGRFLREELEQFLHRDSTAVATRRMVGGLALTA